MKRRTSRAPKDSLFARMEELSPSKPVWSARKLQARTSLPSENSVASLWESDPLTKHLFEGSSWSTEQPMRASQRNRQARYQVPLGRRPPPAALRAAREKELQRFLTACDDDAEDDEAHEASPSTPELRTPQLDQASPSASHVKPDANTSPVPETLPAPAPAVAPRRTARPTDAERRERSDAIAEMMQQQRTNRIDVLSRRPLVNPLQVFREAREVARDAEVASTVATAALVAEEQQKRREMTVRRSKLRKVSSTGHAAPSTPEVADFLAIERQDQERDTKRKCARTIARWATSRLNDERLLTEGAVDAASRLALEDDDTTRKLSAIALRTLASRKVFWEALVQPHVLSTFRELFQEEHHSRHGPSSSTETTVISNTTTVKVHAVPRDAAIALIRLTTGDDTNEGGDDNDDWEARLVDKGVHLLLVQGAERHPGLAEGVACALFNLTCVREPHALMDRVARALVQAPGITASARVRAIVARGLRNMATQPSIVLRLVEEGVVQRIGQLASAALADQHARASRAAVTISQLPDEEDYDDVVREACMRVLLRFAQIPLVRIDMLHAGAPRAIHALLRRPPSRRPAVAKVAGWAACTLGLLAEAPGALDLMTRDKTVDTARTLAIAVESGMAVKNDDDQLASTQAATNAAMAAAMISQSKVGRALVTAPYKSRPESIVTFLDAENGNSASHDVLVASLSTHAALVRLRAKRDAPPTTDRALRFALITLAQLLGDDAHGAAVLAEAVESSSLKSLTQICSRAICDSFPTSLSHSNTTDASSAGTFDPIALLLDDDPENAAADDDLAPSDIDERNEEGSVVPMTPLSRSLVGACALVYDRVTAYAAVRKHDVMARALVPGIVCLAQRVLDHIAEGWDDGDDTETIQPSWCLASCAACLGRLASPARSRPARAVVADGALEAVVRSLEFLHLRKAPGAMRILVRLRDMALEQGGAAPVAFATAAVVLKWWSDGTDAGTSSAAASLFAALSAHADCRACLLEKGLLPALLDYQRRASKSSRGSRGARTSFGSDDELNGLTKTLSKDHEDPASPDDEDDDVENTNCGGDDEGAREPAFKCDDAEPPDNESAGRLCCAVTLANMSLHVRSRVVMVLDAQTVTAVTALSDSSYGEENQLACARALCNLCSAVAHDADGCIVPSLISQRVVAAISMIGAVRASSDATRRVCAAALANLMAPCGNAARPEVFSAANDQGLIPALVRLCRAADLPTRAYAATSLARMSQASAGRDFLASRPLILRVLFAVRAAPLPDELVADMLTTGEDSCRELYVNDKDAESPPEDAVALVLLRRALVRVACRLVTSKSASVALDAGALAHLVDMTLVGSELPELAASLVAIEASGRHARYRLKLLAETQALDGLARFLDAGGDTSRIALTALASFAHDPAVRAAVANNAAVISKLVAVSAQNDTELDPLVVARCLLCVLLAAETPQDVARSVDNGVMRALLSLLSSSSSSKIRDEMAAVVMHAARVVAEVGAGSYEVSRSLRDEGVLEAAGLIAADTAWAQRVTAEDTWASVAYRRAHAALYSFARHHESLRAKLDDICIAAMTVVAACPHWPVRAWTVATLSLVLADSDQRSIVACQLALIESLIAMARDALRPQSGCSRLVAQSLTWCLYQVSRVPRKKTRLALQDAIVLFPKLAAMAASSEPATTDAWIVAAANEATALLASEQYEHDVMTQDGTLQQLVRESFRSSQDEEKNQEIEALLHHYDDFEVLAAVLAPTSSRQADDAELAAVQPEIEVPATKACEVPEETNDVFLCEGAGLGPAVAEPPSIVDFEQIAVDDEDAEAANDDDDDDDPDPDTPTAKRRSSSRTASFDFRTSRRASGVLRASVDVAGDTASPFLAASESPLHKKQRQQQLPWFTKQSIPSKLLEASELEEQGLLRRNNSNNRRGADDDATTSSDDVASEVSNDEADYAGFQFAVTDDNRRSDFKLSSATVEEDDVDESLDWKPNVIEKTSQQLSFLQTQLARILFLRHLTRRDTRCLADAMESQIFEADAKLAVEGADATTLYIIEEGVCEVSRGGAKVREIPEYRQGSPRRHVGELSLVHGKHAGCTVVTKTRVLAWCLDVGTVKMVTRNAAAKKRYFYLDFLLALPLFNQLDENVVRDVCNNLTPVDVEPAEVITREGDVGDAFYIVEEGTVEVVKSIDGNPIVDDKPLTRGSFFGELALLRDIPRSVTIRALTPVSLLKIDKDFFDTKLRGLTFADYDDVVDERTGSESDEGEDLDYDASLVRRFSDRKKKRSTVFAEPLTVLDGWIPPTFDKTDDERNFLTEQTSRLFFLANVEASDVRVLVDAMHLITFKTNETFIRQGEPGDRMYIVESGYCRVTASDIGMITDVPDDQGARLRNEPPRRHVGELALLYDQPRGATVFALSDVRAWCLDRRTFRSILQNAALKRRSNYANFISRVPLFAGLAESQRLVICDALRPVKYKDGDVLITQGAPGDDFFVIEEGQVVVLRKLKGTRLRLRKPSLSTGAFFGELALLRDEPRSATVVALGDVTVLKIDRDTFDRIIGPIDALHCHRYEDDDDDSVETDDSAPVHRRQATVFQGGTAKAARPIQRDAVKPVPKTSTRGGPKLRTGLPNPSAVHLDERRQARRRLKLRPGSLLARSNTAAHRALLHRFVNDGSRTACNDGDTRTPSQ